MEYIQVPIFAVFFLFLAALVPAKPIMVAFGTNQGPIVPPEKPPLQPKTVVTRSPAPVSEQIEDIPNPSTYKPLIPRQYRNKIFAYRPNSLNFDAKYSPSDAKYNIYRKQDRVFGPEYTGPHIFYLQDYEILEAKKLKLQPSVAYIKPQFYQKNNNKLVPEIGVVYSSGVKYYVPQIAEQDGENSVYDRNDEKYFVRGQ